MFNYICSLSAPFLKNKLNICYSCFMIEKFKVPSFLITERFNRPSFLMIEVFNLKGLHVTPGWEVLYSNEILQDFRFIYFQVMIQGFLQDRKWMAPHPSWPDPQQNHCPSTKKTLLMPDPPAFLPIVGHLKVNKQIKWIFIVMHAKIGYPFQLLLTAKFLI